MHKKNYYKFVDDLLTDYLSNTFVSFNIKFVFICGGAGEDSKRNQFKKYFNKNYKDSELTLVYAENFAKVRELFNSSADERDDLLSLENFLSEFCQCVLIILESAGSLVELGAFSNIDDLLKKILLVNEISHKKDKSFINDGPIKKIKSKSIFDSIIYYHDEYFVESIEKVINTIKNKLQRRNSFIKLSSYNFDNNRVYKICIITKFLGIISPVTKFEATKIFKGIKLFGNNTKENSFFLDFILSMGWFKMIGSEGYIVPLNSFNDCLKERSFRFNSHECRAKIIRYYNKHNKEKLDLIRNSIDNEEDYLASINNGKKE